ncbi:MAG: hypothetical protein JW894_09550 [Bacteroidales bacterium]|nr:hypothetical protein [Bacteroidales bacterium]
MIPSIKNKGWRELLLETGKYNISSHLLKMKLNAIKKRLNLGALSLEQAINELYKECADNPDLYQNDIYQIFKHETNHS